MTRRKHLVLASVATVLVSAAPAQAHVPHTVEPGETLWSIAAASNFTTRTVAAFNGLSEDAHVLEGQTIWVPSVPEGVAALQKAGLTAAPASTSSAPATTTAASTSSSSGGGYTVQPGDTLSGLAARTGASAAEIAAMNGLTLEGPLIAGTSITLPGGAATSTTTAVSTTTAAAPEPLGAYKVRPGDTLSGIAAVARVRASDIAAMNGLSLEGPLLAGTVIKLPTGSPVPSSAVSTPAPERTVVPAADPAPAPGRLSAAEIQSIAAEHGVSPSLAAAIAWQESGFNNAMVSSANARGVMQVMPGTWDYVQENLAQQPLDPASPHDNVRAGVIYLRRLLDETGGDESAATAAYYQGLGALRSRGMFDDTKRYVANVQALRARFGG